MHVGYNNDVVGICQPNQPSSIAVQFLYQTDSVVELTVYATAQPNRHDQLQPLAFDPVIGRGPMDPVIRSTEVDNECSG